MDLKRLFTLAAKATFYVVSRTVGFSAFGLLLNLVFLLVLIPEVRALAGDMGRMPVARAGLFGAVLAAVIGWWPAILVVLVIGVGLPAAYYLLGQKHGLRRALLFLVSEHKGFVVQYFVDRLFDFIRKRPEWVERLNKSGLRATLNEVLPVYLARLDNLPYAMRKLFGLLVERVDFRGILVRVVETRQIEELDVERVSAAAAEEVGAYLDEKFLQASLTWFWLLLGANVALVVGLKLAV